MMTDHKLHELQSIRRQQCLFRAFADINLSFADWYQTTERIAEEMDKKNLK